LMAKYRPSAQKAESAIKEEEEESQGRIFEMGQKRGLIDFALSKWHKKPRNN